MVDERDWKSAGKEPEVEELLLLLLRKIFREREGKEAVPFIYISSRVKKWLQRGRHSPLPELSLVEAY